MVVIRKPFNAPRQNAIKTHCPQGHEYTPENTRWSKNPTHGGKMRGCKQCHRDQSKKRRVAALSSQQRPQED